ncbi:hypothetical protein GYA19_00520 [Candidatus Beckwithbacteria bacterium]|nr:hypothetical protein [Candidatus Beckwithbacteria bacterium]
MITTHKLFDYLHTQIFSPELRNKAQQLDSNANGIQILGQEKVDKIALGVSCNLEFLEKAVSWGAQICLFHHGLGLNEKYIYNSCLDLSLQKQLKIIFENELTIAGYHYYLDVHPQIGNNALIAKNLGAKINGKYFDDWGITAAFDKPKMLEEIAKDCTKLFKHDVFMVLGGQKEIQNIAVCSGAAILKAKQIKEILDKKIELHITGEISERMPALARENVFNYFACGHYATEVFGIQEIGEKINEQFPELDIRFIEVWNEI